MDQEKILAWAKKNGPHVRHFVVTGGEPAIYDLRPLCDASLLDNSGWPDWTIQIVTVGTHVLTAGSAPCATQAPKPSVTTSWEWPIR